MSALARISPPSHDTRDLETLFERTFLEKENTLLLRHRDAWRRDFASADAVEPIYLPADDSCPHHRIVYAHGFFASALHEIAHWCVAGPQRRLKVDYGYWYEPDDRDAEQQAEFERVEARPQAVEWALCISAGFPFEVSVDNLSGIAVDREGFTRRVHARLLEMVEDDSLPPRARRLMQVLEAFHATTFALPELTE